MKFLKDLVSELISTKKQSISLMSSFAFLLILITITYGAMSVFSAQAIASTSVGGVIGQNTIWTLTNSPYVITNSITINSGVTLTVEPGVIIKFNSTSRNIVVNGTLQADGTSTDKIYFTSFKDDSVGGDTNGDGSATLPAKGDWSYIKLNSSSFNSIIDNCVIKYGGNYYGHAVNVISNSHSITNNSFQNNNGYPITTNINTTLNISGNYASNNTYNGIDASGTSLTNSVTWRGHDLPYIIAATGFVTVGTGITLTIEPGTVVKFKYANGGISVNGTLQADGTPTDKIFYTSFKDDSVGGDTNGDGSATLPAKSNWYNIKFNSTSTNSLLDNCIIKYGGNNYDYAVNASSNSLNITNNIFQDNNGYPVYVSNNTTLGLHPFHRTAS